MSAILPDLVMIKRCIYPQELAAAKEELQEAASLERQLRLEISNHESMIKQKTKTIGWSDPNPCIPIHVRPQSIHPKPEPLGWPQSIHPKPETPIHWGQTPQSIGVWLWGLDPIHASQARNLKSAKLQP